MTRLPTVTVIIPTKNRPEMLSACLQNLARQDYPRGRWNAVVVNDGGADPAALPAGPDNAGFSLTLITTAPCGPAAARNLGAKDSKADLLAYLDDDCLAEASWLRQMACGIGSSPYDACSGRTLNAFPNLWPCRAYQYFMEFYRDYERLANGDLYLVMSNNAVYRREVFERLGGFNESFPRPGAEDLELSHRAAAKGCRQGYLPEAVLRHAHSATAAGYLRQQFQYGRGYARMAANLKREGIPLNIGQRRRPQFHLALLQAMGRRNPGLREGMLIGCGMLAHWLGARRETLRLHAETSRPAGEAA